MSYIHVLIAKDDNLFFVTLPYKAAKKFIEEGFKGNLALLKPRFLDAGYVVLDLNRKTIINGQNAFAIKSDFDVYNT